MIRLDFFCDIGFTKRCICLVFLILLLSPSLGLSQEQELSNFDYYLDEGESRYESKEANHGIESKPHFTRVLHVDLGFKFAIPEGSGLELQVQPSPYWAFSGHILSAPKVVVNYSIPSKFLLSESSYAIEQPNINIPIHAKFGPHIGGGISIFPFGGTFYLLGGYQQRTITLKSSATSPVNFLDIDTRIESNSSLFAEASTHTKQSVARFELGQRVPFAFGKMFFSWFVGFSVALTSQSSQHVNIELRNLKASEPSEVTAINFQDKEKIEETKAETDLARMLQDIEHLMLPTAGLSIGWRW